MGDPLLVPLHEGMVDWLFDAHAWMCSALRGRAAFGAIELVQPTDHDFPLDGESGHALALALLECVSEHMGVRDFDGPLVPFEPFEAPEAAAAFVVDGAGRRCIKYDDRLLDEPMALVAALSHEIAHHLLHDVASEPPGGERLLEHATDALSVFLGFGIFASNAAYSRRSTMGHAGWGYSERRSGYLGQEAASHALAMFCALRDIPAARVEPHLGPDAATLFREAQARLRAERARDLAWLRAVIAGEAAGERPGPEPVAPGLWARMKGALRRDKRLAPPSVAELAATLQRAMQREGEQRPMRFDPYSERLLLDDPAGGRSVDLGRLYESYAEASAEDRDALIELWARPVGDVPPTLEAAAPNLHLELAPSFWLAAEPGIAVPRARPIGRHLCATLVYDRGSWFERIADDRLAQWGTDFETAFGRASEGLFDVDVFRQEVFFAVQGHDAASVLCTSLPPGRLHGAPDLFDQHAFGGAPWIVPVQRDCALVADGAQPDRVVLMLLTAMLMADEERDWLSLMPLVRGEDGTLRDVDRSSAEGELAGVLASVERYELDRAYRATTALARAAYPRHLVADYDLTLNDEVSEARATWVPTLPTLLPRVDVVTLAARRAGVVQALGDVAWDELVAAMAPEPVLIEGCPPRYRFDRAPSGAELAAMQVAHRD